MRDEPDFDLKDFLPYLLNLAAEEASLGFQVHYKTRYGMLRTEWRVLFHLGRYGEMTAKEICDRAQLHKTVVSRAVAKLEARRFLRRREMAQDRRAEVLALTDQGHAAYAELRTQAQAYEARLAAPFTAQEAAALRKALKLLAKL
jgi:DNA-binding MarR family transcriptional regulator